MKDISKTKSIPTPDLNASGPYAEIGPAVAAVKNKIMRKKKGETLNSIKADAISETIGRIHGKKTA